MINRKVDDAVFEAILKQAFCDAFTQEIEQIEAADDQPAQPSATNRKKERWYYKKQQRKPIKAAAIVRGLAACAMFAICLVSGIMMTSAPVRAAVVDTFVGFFEKYLTVDVGNEDGAIVIGEYTMGYVPNGFELVDTRETSYFNSHTFSNGSEKFMVYFYPHNESLLKYDNEQTDLTITKINESEGYFVNSEDGICVLFWNLNSQTVSIESNLNMNIIKKIAENIS